MKKTKIVCTIGPSSEKKEQEALYLKRPFRRTEVEGDVSTYPVVF